VFASWRIASARPRMKTCLVVASELRRRKFLRIVKPSKFKFLIESRLKASEESAKLKEKTSSSSFPDRD